MGNETNQHGIEPSTSLPFLIGEGSALGSASKERSYESYDYAKAFYQLGKVHYDKTGLISNQKKTFKNL